MIMIDYLFEYDEFDNVTKYIGTDSENVFPTNCRQVGSNN